MSKTLGEPICHPIGPQKMKTQAQASQKDTKDDGHIQSVSEYNMDQDNKELEGSTLGSDEGKIHLNVSELF
jgi:hypothetical protein